MARSVARFGTLLCKLSMETEKQTNSIISLTRWLVVLTVMLLLLTAALLYKEFYH